MELTRGDADRAGIQAALYIISAILLWNMGSSFAWMFLGLAVLFQLAAMLREITVNKKNPR